MKKNEVIQVSKIEIGTDKIEYISGKINDAGNNKCRLSSNTGSVYGIAIKFEDDEDRSNFVNCILGDKCIKNIKNFNKLENYW